MTRLTLLTTLALAACGARTQRGGFQDAMAAQDARRDAPVVRDQRVRDAFLNDVRVDGLPVDASTDMPFDAIIVDAPATDSAVDGIVVVDMGADVLPADAAVDLGPNTPCQVNANSPAGDPLVALAMDMVVCRAATSVDQCSAAAACGPNWHLCRASEYLARGGTSAGFGQAWLASCVREGSATQAPSDGVCAHCLNQLSTSKQVRWSCSGQGGATSASTWIGVRSHGACFRVGVNDPAYAAFWNTRNANGALPYAVCCQ